jgi:UDP-2-acetamido-3-amino-2,3-dideoxy-glucuronate N-acetyltransferase
MIHDFQGVHHTVHLGHGAEVFLPVLLMEGVQVGENTLIWPFVVIGRHVQIGRGCRIQPGVAIADDTIIGQFVFIGSNVSLADCRYPQLRDKAQEVHTPCAIADDVQIGCNAVILPGVMVHAGAIIGAGAVVTRDVKAGCCVAGNPARPLFTQRGTRLPVNEAGQLLGGSYG